MIRAKLEALAERVEGTVALLRLGITAEEVEYLRLDGRCECGHLAVFHHYNGGGDRCAIDGCECSW